MIKGSGRYRSFSATVFARAKVNVTLLVTGVRPDGYHNILTVFAPLVLADKLVVTVGPGKGVVVKSNNPAAPGSEKNLAARAASAFLHAAGVTARVEIDLEKNVHVGAGLGGGSSDAAAVLRTLNERWRNVFDADALWRLAWSLGADVPFFLLDGWALGAGRGEILTPLRGPKEVPLLLAAPRRGIPTAKVYAALAPRDFVSSADPVWRVIARLSGDVGDWWREGVNSLEEPACRSFPILKKVKAKMADLGFDNARLSGAGGAFVAPVIDRCKAQAAAAALRAAGFWSVVTATAGV